MFQAEDGIRDLVRSRGLGDVYKRQTLAGHPDPNQIYADEVIAVRDDDPETSGLDHVLTLSLIHI